MPIIPLVGVKLQLSYQVIQAVPFSSPIVSGHEQPLERVTFSPSQKGHGLNHQVPIYDIFSAIKKG